MDSLLEPLEEGQPCLNPGCRLRASWMWEIHSSVLKYHICAHYGNSELQGNKYSYTKKKRHHKWSYLREVQILIFCEMQNQPLVSVHGWLVCIFRAFFRLDSCLIHFLPQSYFAFLLKQFWLWPYMRYNTDWLRWIWVCGYNSRLLLSSELLDILSTSIFTQCMYVYVPEIILSFERFIIK